MQSAGLLHVNLCTSHLYGAPAFIPHTCGSLSQQDFILIQIEMQLPTQRHLKSNTVSVDTRLKHCINWYLPHYGSSWIPLRSSVKHFLLLIKALELSGALWARAHTAEDIHKQQKQLFVETLCYLLVVDDGGDKLCDLSPSGPTMGMPEGVKARCRQTSVWHLKPSVNPL